LLILRDNWQGEFCVALFGALGWTVISMLSGDADNLINKPQLAILNRIMPEWAWELWFAVFGIIQLYGLRNPPWSHGRIARAVGALGVFLGLMCVFLAVLMTSPWANSLALYLACICIEFCAIIFHTANVMRFQEYPRWIGKL
jgi:hypothetical protein